MLNTLISKNQSAGYYAHNKEKYHTPLETYEKEVIKENFP